MIRLGAAVIKGFQATVWQYYVAHGRHDLPWRQPDAKGSFDPYKILVSELMLQQTQVARVIPKYYEFLAAFPTVEHLAQAELGEVLRAWSGLGYNRRAKYLHQAAQAIATNYGSVVPGSITELVKLPGIGKNTAGAIMAYAFNTPAVFLETNIRTVYIHHFFEDAANIPDTELASLLEQTVDNTKPRQFYWALMDHGSHLKKTIGNLSTLSKQYKKQTTFSGSRRQLRGQALRLLAKKPATAQSLADVTGDVRLPAVLDELLAEGLIRRSGQTYSL